MDLVAIDFETANSDRDSVCEVGITVVEDWKIIASYSHLVKPKDNWFDSFNTSLHGIDAKMVKDQPEFDAIWDAMKPVVEGKNLIAHNAGFDMGVLRAVLSDYSIEYPSFQYTCSYQIAKRAWSGLLSYRLDSICKHLNISLDHHRAQSDSEASVRIAMEAFKLHDVSEFGQLEEVFKLKIGNVYAGGYSPSLSKSLNKGYKISDIEYDKEKADPENIFFNRNVVFTGTLSSLVRKDAQKMVLEIGGSCSPGVNKETNYLVVGEQDFTKYGDGFKSSKMKKAEQLLAAGQNIELVTEGQFIEHFGK